MTKFVLICATGRSASTTLQRILATIPSSCITGEKLGAIESLLEGYQRLKQTQQTYVPLNANGAFCTWEELKEGNQKPAWFNTFDLEEVRTNLRTTLLSILAPSASQGQFAVLGYKDIRWFNKLHLVDEFVELFPNTKVVCHFRQDLDSQLCSGWWTEANRDHLVAYNAQLVAYAGAASRQSWCYLSTMEALFEAEKRQQLFAFLEEPLNEEEVSCILKNNVDLLSMEDNVLKRWRLFVEREMMPIIRNCGEKLEGNIYSYHEDVNYNVKYYEKQCNIATCGASLPPQARMLEIGFNSGFSALLLLMASDPSVTLTCVDINCHKYTMPCFNLLKQHFGDRIRLVTGDSMAVLPTMSGTYDLIHIDGGHSTTIARSDIQHSLRLAKNDSLLIMDDVDAECLSAVWSEHVREHRLKDPRLPLMPCVHHSVKQR